MNSIKETKGENDKKNDDCYLTYRRLLQEQERREADRQYVNDGCINKKAVSDTQRPPKPSMSGKKEMTETTSSAK